MFARRAVLSIPMAVALTWVPCAASADEGYAPSAAAAYAAFAVAECMATGHWASAPEGQDDPSGKEAGSHERVIPVHALPIPVRVALMSLGKGAVILEAEEELDEGRMTYEIDVRLGDVFYELEFDAAGNVLGSEIAAWVIPLDSIPEPARSAIEMEAAGGTIVEVRKAELEDVGEFVYEADIRKGKRTYVLVIDPHGMLIERDVTIEMLPPGAAEVLRYVAQGGSLVELEEELNDGRFSYDANIVLGNVEISISVDADGNLLELDC